MTQLLKMPSSPVGWWHVTTEGDEEGKSIRDLGCWQGHIADIARMLADKCYYVLRFEELAAPPFIDETKGKISGEVEISLGCKTGTWNLPHDLRAEIIGDFLKQEQGKVRYDCTSNGGYSGVVLKYDASPIPNKEEDDKFVG